MSLLQRILGRERRDRQSVALSDPYLGEFLHRPPSAHVDPHRASGTSVAYACVAVISQSLASVPLRLYRRTENGGRDRAAEHPLYAVLHDIAADGLTAFELREMLASSLLIHGNAYALIDWNGRGQATALHPLHAANVAVERLDSGRCRYHVHDPRGRSATYTQDEVLHLRHRLDSDGITGLSPVQVARETFALDLTQQEQAAKLARRSHRAEGVLSFPARISQTAKELAFSKLADRFEHDMTSSGGLMVLDGGAEWRPMSFSPKDGEFLESRKLSDLAIARIFGVPPTCVGIVEHATYSNVDGESRALVMRCLAPMARRIEQAMTATLLPVAARRQLFIEHDLAGLLRGDLKARFESYRIGREWGWLSPNEIRRMENMSEIDGGDEYLSPLNMSTQGKRDDLG